MKHKFFLLCLVIALVLITVFLRESTHYVIWMVFAVFVYLLILFLGVVTPKYNYFYKGIHSVKKPEVLLTFDDGPNPETTPKILDVLKENQVGAVFFVIGKNVEQHPDIAKRIIREGHLVGNHTYSHPIFFALMGKAKLKEEINKGFQIISRHLNVKTNLFRQPIGYSNPSIANVINVMNLKSIGWEVRSRDSFIKNEEKLLSRLLNITKPGRIILLHDSLSQTANVLEQYIKQAKENGTKFATTDRLKQLINV